MDISGVSTLHRFAEDAGEFNVASAGWEDAIAVGEDPNAVRFAAGVVTREATPFPSDSLTDVVHLGELGYVASTGRGQIVRRVGESWESMGNTDFVLTILALDAYPRGLVFGGQNGGFAQYVEGRGFCEVEFPIAGQIEGLHTLGERIVLIQKYLMNGIAVLEP
jgi:hypothetical protein